MASGRTLNVYLDGTFIGQTRQSAQGDLSFVYDEGYLEGTDVTPLSLSMPTDVVEHRSKLVRAFLEGLLPDSPAARARWGRQYGVSPNNPFSLLTHVGRDAAGAVQVLPPDVPARDASARTGAIEWLSDDDFAVMARDLAASGADWDPGRPGGRWSLAGAQPKMALFRDPGSGRWGIPQDSTPTTHVLKPAIDGFAQHHVNEALCLTAASRAGLLAARTELVDMAGIQAVISHRYDRRRDESGRWIRVHQEDFCQALSVHPSLKYQSDGGPGVGQMADLLARLDVDDRMISRERLIKALAFNVLIGGTDAHAKNYSMVLIGARAQVAPLYDVASAACYPQHERLSSPIKIGAHWKMLDVTRADWARVAQRFAVPADTVVGWVDELRAELPRAFDEAVRELPADARSVASDMAERIVEHVHGSWRPDLDRNPGRVLR